MNLMATSLLEGFSKTFDSTHRGKMEQILQAYGLSKEVIFAILKLYKSTKAMVQSHDGDTDYFDIVPGILQGDTFAPYLFILCLDYLLQKSIDLI